MMGPIGKKLRWPHLLVIFAIAAMLVPITLFSSTEEAEAQSTGGEAGAPLTLSESYMFIREGMEMSPQAFSTGAETQSHLIPNGWRSTGLLGFGILKRYGRTEWMEVGTWTSKPLRERLYLGGKVTFAIWAYNEEYGVQSDFEFIILKGGEQNPLVSVTVNNKALSTDSNAPTKIQASVNFPPGNDTMIDGGETMAFKLMARCNGGATLAFGTPTYHSGFAFSSNALTIHSIYMDETAVTCEYKDAFLVPWVTMKTDATIDNVGLLDEHRTSQMNIVNGTRELIWEGEYSYGNHEIAVSLSYDPEGTRNVSKVVNVKISRPEVNTFRQIWNTLKSNLVVIILVILLIVAFFFYVRHRKKLWRRRFRSLPPEGQSLKKRKKKKMWKRIRKQEKKQKKARKKMDREEIEETETGGEGGFSLFKKKNRGPRVEKVQAVDDSVFEDLDFD